jgi:FRG domain-containing protein
METIGKHRIWSFFDTTKFCKDTDNTTIRKGVGHQVESYLNLAKKVAELQFRNRDFVLLFHGQGNDYRNQHGNTSLKPTLFRPERVRNPSEQTLVRRFEALQIAEELLIRGYKSPEFLGVERLQRHRILRWAILQHYEVCPTPLLDVTHSLRIAASFASLASAKASGSVNKKGFVFVLGVPNLSGAITASAEAGLQIVRLSSVCPPSAVRPHIQEGYQLGEYPEITGYRQKARYAPYEVDFGLRLVAKFCFNPDDFWKRPDFPMVAREALYPDGDDPLYKLTRAVARGLPADATTASASRRRQDGKRK